MSKLAKFKAKGSDLTEEEWEEILRIRRKGTYAGLNFVELTTKKERGFIEIGCKK